MKYIVDHVNKVSKVETSANNERNSEYTNIESRSCQCSISQSMSPKICHSQAKNESQPCRSAKK